MDNAHDAAINALAVDPNGGNWVLTAGNDGWAKVFDVRTGAVLHVLASPRKISEGTWVGTAPAGVTTTADGALDGDSRRCEGEMEGERRWEGETDGATDLFKLTAAVSSRSGWAAVTGADQSIRFFDSTTWEPRGVKWLGNSAKTRVPVFMGVLVT